MEKRFTNKFMTHYNENNYENRETARDTTHGWYDIYMLHTREDKMYITEVAYEFGA